MERSNFAEGFAALCQMYEKEPSKILTDMYYEILKDLSDDEWKKAVGTVLSNRVYPGMPKPAEFIQAIRGSVDDTHYALFQELMTAAQIHGPYDDILFTHPAIGEWIRDHGGWAKFCATEEPIEFLERDFLRAMKSLVRSGRPHDDKMRLVIGIHHTNNAALGEPGMQLIKPPKNMSGVKMLPVPVSEPRQIDEPEEEEETE